MPGFEKSEAEGNFEKARTRAVIQNMLGLLGRQRRELLSFEEVKKMLRPRTQAYKGLQVVPINLIVGSEGRYQDFSKQFLPKRKYLRNRWTSVDVARISDITLPPIQLYELGGVYFVRDGNHRVSVARSQGGEMIDAEVISLSSEIHIDPNMGRENLREAVIQYEYRRFAEKTKVEELFPEADLRLTSTGQYEEILYHIQVHKYFINQDFEDEIPFSEAFKSWYINLYLPIVDIVRSEHLVDFFPGRTETDLYVWVVKHWHYLKEKYGDRVSAKDAAISYSRMFGTTPLWHIGAWFRSLFRK